MATARERVQSLDARLRELEERFIGGGFSSSVAPSLPPLPDLPSATIADAAPVQPATGALNYVPHGGNSVGHNVVTVLGSQPLAPEATAYDHLQARSVGTSSSLLSVTSTRFHAGAPSGTTDGVGPPDRRVTTAPSTAPSTGMPELSRPQPDGQLRRDLTAPEGHPACQPEDVGRPAAPPPAPSNYAEVPLRLYRQGLPHRDLGPPQSVWEADKNAAVVALADRVQQLERELQQQQQQQPQQEQQGQQEPEKAPPTTHAVPDVMPPPSVDLLPVPRTVLGSSSHANVAAFDGTNLGGKPPLPVKYYPPPQPGQPLSPEAAVRRLPAAQGARGQARAFAASVAASAAATVPSVMMRKWQNENALSAGSAPAGAGGDENVSSMPIAGSPLGGVGGGGGSSVGVSAPLGRASAAASAAASVHVAALREAGPLQPAGPYPMVSAALAAGTPGSGGSTWEQAKMRALVSLEQQRDQLRAQLETYHDLEARHRRQMLDLNEKHRKDLTAAAGIAGRKLDRLMSSAWAVLARRLLVLRVSRALHAWRRIAARNRRLIWAAAVWRQRELSAAFSGWHMLVLSNRHERQARRRALTRYARSVLLAWAAAARDSQRMRRLERRAAAGRCRRLLAAWVRRTWELRSKRLQLQGAERHRQGVLLRKGWRGLAAEVVRGRQAEVALRQRLARTALLASFQTWVARVRLGRRLDAMHRRAVLRTVLCSWAAHASRASSLRRKVRGLQAVWRRRRIAILIGAWCAVARRLAQLRSASEVLQRAIRRELLATALICFRLAPRERAWVRRRGVTALRAWRALALRASRNRRIVLTRQLARNRASLAAIYDAWRVLAKARQVRLHLREIHRLQELEPTYEHQMELVRQDRAAVQSHVRAVMAELNLLRAELLRGFVMSAEGGLLGKPLRWRSLPPDPDQWMPQPRCRHSTLFLRALQLPASPGAGARGQALPVHSTLRASLLGTGTAVLSPRAGAGGAAEGFSPRAGATGQWQHTGTAQLGTPAATGTGGHGHHAEDMEAVGPDVAGVLVVFGGVSEEEWFRDVHVLEVSYSDGPSVKFHFHQVEVELEAEPVDGVEGGTQRATWPTATGGGGGTTAAATEGKLPLHTRRDHAACVTSPNQFVVVGGFDGTSELMDIHAVTVRAAEDSVGWAASVRPVRPRNRTPPGRSHHTVTAHPAGRSLYVFGGYASARGALNELWAFHMDHHEWWQPNTTGDQPPPRRNHVAALVGGRLYIHGGFNGTECLADTWVLDPQTWHWDQLKDVGVPPSPRRGHAADVVDDRYLVVHGGYDGAGYLGDGAVLDTATATWRDLAAAGGPEDMPTARAHHTLTLVGHVMVALGGSGPMGPLLDMHLLESPPLVAGLVQQYRMMATAAQLSATQAGMADTEAALLVTRNRAEIAEQQLQVLRERSSELVSRHNAALADIDRLKQRVAAETVRVVAAEAATAQAQLALATAERRLRRTREGGNEMAAAARDMHDTVCDLREEVARLRAQALATTQQQSRDASNLATTMAERQLLQQQLAGSQQEAALLRGMLATAESEFRAALERQRSAADVELAAANERAKQMAVAAAAAAGGAAAAGTAADMDLVALHQLATATARAETAEIRLHAMEREYGGLQADLSNVKRQLQQQHQAREAAEERAAAAMQHMHASELRYQQQLEDLQRQLLEAQRERWRADLGLMPPRQRAVAQPADAGNTPATAVPQGRQPQEPQVQSSQLPREGPVGPSGSGGDGVGTRKEADAERQEAEALLLNARPPPELQAGGPQGQARSFMTARVSAMLDPTDPQMHFTVQHVEKLLVEDPALEVLPEVARLLQLQRRALGQGS